MTRMFSSSTHMPGTQLLLLCMIMAFFILGLILGSAMKCPCSVQVRSYPWAFVPTQENVESHENTDLSIIYQGKIKILDDLRNIRRQLEVIRKPRVYRKDETGWINDFSICGSFPKFKMSFMDTEVGKTPIFVHEYKNSFQHKGNLYRLTNLELKLQNVIFKLLEADERIQFIEFGARVGSYFLAVAKFGRSVIAVESQKVNMERLCSSVIVGNFTDKTTLIYDPLLESSSHVNINANSDMHSSLDDILHIPEYNLDFIILKIDTPNISKLLDTGDRFFRKVNIVHVLMNWNHTRSSLESDGNDVIEYLSSRFYAPYNPFDQETQLNTTEAHYWPSVVLWKNTYNIKLNI